jgi:REP element-mobilizing transposase RayT
MITINKGPKTPRLAEIVNEPLPGMAMRPVVKLSAAGDIALRTLYKLPDRYPQVYIRNSVIMPDHIHFIIQVTKQSDRALSYIIGSYMGFCTSEFRRRFPNQQAEAAGNQLQGKPAQRRMKTAGEDSFFAKGFHDRIVMDRGQLPRLVAYINDNPLRYLIKRQFPGYFRSARQIRFADEVYWAYGNFLLLKDPCKMAVRVSSKFTAEQLAQYKQQWMATARNGGVLISPWISPAEKEIRRSALAVGGKIISIVESGFSERYKPQGYEFELCSEGRLLQVAVAPYTSKTVALSRRQAMTMNALADRLAGQMEFSLVRSLAGQA